MKRSMIALVAAVAVASSALAAGTVTLTLESTQNGATVTAGATIDWTIKATVSTGDNFGLALISVDLVQDGANPEVLAIPKADIASIDATMAQFNRPQGISNPGEDGATTGYIGSQRGTGGALNLIQIGGAQNTFGAAGSTMGLDYNVQGGVGQSGAQIIASGSFAAPATSGTYTFSLQNALANVLDAVNTPPSFSPVSAATVDATGATISISVSIGPVICPGDANCDGEVNFFDIDPFVVALTASNNASVWQTWLAANGYASDCSFLNNDTNGDLSVDFFDIDPFVTLLSTGATCP